MSNKEHRNEQLSDCASIAQVSWPKSGKNSHFLTLNIPHCTDALCKEALLFICNHCCYVTGKQFRRFITVPGIYSDKEVRKELLQLENLFTDPIGAGTDNAKYVDDYRFQTNPDQEEYLLRCPAIKTIVQLTQHVVDAEVTGYVCTQISLLYSRPGGAPQGLHHDVPRENHSIVEEGDTLSAIVALQDATRLDIANDLGVRKTYSIPSGSMFLFSGTCYHGGSSFPNSNARIHMYFVPKTDSGNNRVTNVIPERLLCPITDCKHNKNRKTYSRTQLYDHWKLHHRKDIGLSVGKYILKCNDGHVLQCLLCRKGFLNNRGLSRHKKHCRGSIPGP